MESKAQNTQTAYTWILLPQQTAPVLAGKIAYFNDTYLVGQCCHERVCVTKLVVKNEGRDVKS